MLATFFVKKLLSYFRVDLRPDDRWEEQKIKSQTRNSDKNARKRHQNRQQHIEESVKSVSQAEPSSTAQSWATVEHKSRNSGITGRSTTTPLPDSSAAPNVVITAAAIGANDATTDAAYSSIFDSINPTTNENFFQTTILPDEEKLVTTTELLRISSDYPEQPRSRDHVSSLSPPSLSENSKKSFQVGPNQNIFTVC